MGIFFTWLFFSLGIAALADSRGRNGFGFFVLSVFLSPLVGLIVVLAIRNLKADAIAAARREQDHQRQAQSLAAIGAGKQGARLSIADELSKLSELRERGILTDAEFQTQKVNVLARQA